MKKFIELCKKFNIDFKFIKFLFVGCLNTVFGYSIFALFIFLGFHYILAVTLSTIIAIIFNFFSTGRLVFKNNNNQLIFKFLFVYFITWLINTGFIYIYKLFIGSNLYIAGFLILFPNAMLTFILMKYYVFKVKPNL